jgi:acylphosphatase
MTEAEGDQRARRSVIYAGRVQGVCFRATAEEISGGYGVTGYVRNRRDGTVELEAEGRLTEVQAFLDAVARHFAPNIAHIETRTLPPRGDETEFRISY